MLLDQQSVEALRQLLEDRQFASLTQLGIKQLSLVGLLELACCAYEQRSCDDLDAKNFFGDLRRRFPAVHQAFRLLGSAISTRWDHPQQTFSAPPFELAPVRAGWLNSSNWQLFLQRFSRTLRHHGYGEHFPDALAGAFGEMADNVVQHSAATGEPSAHGLAAFHVTSDQATFVVIDTGRGLLASLQVNPRWQHLRENAQALEAVVRQRATRKVQNRYGDGFSEVFNALVDRNGAVRLRSREASVRLGSERHGRRFELEFGPAASGVCVCVTCSLRGQPQEIALPDEENP